MFKLFGVFLMASVRLFHKTYQGMERCSNPCCSFKTDLKFYKTNVFVHFTMKSIFKDFPQIGRTVLIDTFEYCYIYALVESFIGRQPIYPSKFRKKYVIHFIENKLYTFILHILYFILHILYFFPIFFGKAIIVKI